MKTYYLGLNSQHNQQHISSLSLRLSRTNTQSDSLLRTQGLKAMACQMLDSASANSLPILDNEQDREIKEWWQERL